MKESTLVRQILDYLNNLPQCKAIKIHGSRFQEAGTPDILCCKDGKTVFIECKIGKEKVTPIQELRLKQWQDAGASCLVAYSLEDVSSIQNDFFSDLYRSVSQSFS